MKRVLFASSPGLVFAARAVCDVIFAGRSLDFGPLEREQRVAKLTTGSPSLTYEIQVELDELAPSDRVVEFGVEAEGGLVLCDGYAFAPSETSRRTAILQIPDGYYRVRAVALPTISSGTMLLRISLAMTAERLAAEGADLDYLPPRIV